MENIRKKKSASNGRKKTIEAPVTVEEIAAYEEMFLCDDRCASRKSLHINAQYRRRILSLVCATGRSGGFSTFPFPFLLLRFAGC